MAEILRPKSTARNSLVSSYLLLNLSSGGNSAAEIHSENFPSLNLSSLQLIIFSTYQQAEILLRKSPARISQVSTYLEQLGYKGNEEEIIGSANLNRSRNPCHSYIGSAKLSLILLTIRWFEKAPQAGGRRDGYPLGISVGIEASRLYPCQ